MCTHEEFIHAVRKAALAFAEQTYNAAPLTDEQRQRLQAAKMVYGRGMRGLRGLTQYNAWKHTSQSDFIEICALGEESWIQLAGTTIHELGHVLAGPGSGHGKEWKQACAMLGLRRVHAAGTQYMLANFHPWLRNRLALMSKPADGSPDCGTEVFRATARGCSAGIGTKGGKSRGAGSGSRMRRYVCGHGQIIRAATDALQCTCGVCNGQFQLT